MGCNFAGYLNTAFFRFFNKIRASRRRNVADMQLCTRRFREEDVACDDDFFARLCACDEPGELRFRFVDFHRGHAVPLANNVS